MNVDPPARPRMARISLFGIAAVLMRSTVAGLAGPLSAAATQKCLSGLLTGITLWVSSSHSAAIERPQIDPFSLMANAKNLPSQEIAHFEDVAGYRGCPLLVRPTITTKRIAANIAKLPELLAKV